MAATSNCSSSPSSSRSLNNIPFLDDHDQYQNIRGVLPTRSSGNYSIIGDNYNSLEEVAEALQQAGLESSNLIVGIDFTKSNEWTGGRCFGRKNLHFLGQDLNPYEQAISIIGRTLSTFDEDNLIPCYDFASTHDKDVFSFFPKDKPCRGFEELLSRYRELVPRINLSGPTSFAPIIENAISIVDSKAAFHLNPSYQPSRSCMESSVHHNPLHRVLAYTTPLANHSKEKPEIIRAQTGSVMRLGVVGGSTYKTIVSLTQSHQTRFLTISTQKESMADDGGRFAQKSRQTAPIKAPSRCRVSVPLILSVPATVLSLSKKNQLKVKVNTVLGSNAPSLTVKLVRASKSGSKDGSVIESQ
ncbi:hypothetical protein G4B88_001774, partial [Cannabis sativa]